MFKVIRAAVAAFALLGALLLVAPGHAEASPPGVSGSAAEMQDCNCWDDLLEQLQEEQRNESPKSNDAASSFTS
jgi:hypothetical protein